MWRRMRVVVAVAVLAALMTAPTDAEAEIREGGELWTDYVENWYPQINGPYVPQLLGTTSASPRSYGPGDDVTIDVTVTRPLDTCTNSAGNELSTGGYDVQITWSGAQRVSSTPATSTDYTINAQTSSIQWRRKPGGWIAPGTTFSAVFKAPSIAAKPLVTILASKLQANRCTSVVDYPSILLHAHGDPTLGDADTDGDGLLDRWETDGVDVDGDGDIDVDLPAMGADRNVRDIFVQSDWMVKLDTAQAAPWLTIDLLSRRPTAASLDALMDAFAAAPGGPIRLHVDAGPDSVMNPVNRATWGSLSRAKAVNFVEDISTAPGPPDWDYFDILHVGDPERADVFHSVLHAETIGWVPRDAGYRSDLTGASESTPGDRFLLARADHRPLSLFEESGVFMHELGHNLGLYHEGGPNGTCNQCPEYHSIMNYRYVYDPLDGGIDYSRGAPYDDWSNLDLSGGTIGPPIDADLVDEDAPRADGDGSIEIVGPFTMLADTGDRELYADVHNPSTTSALYTVELSGDLDPVTATKTVTVPAGGTGRVTFAVDTDAALVGTADVHLDLDSNLLGRVAEADVPIGVVDPNAVAQDLAAARYELAGMATGTIDPAVKASLLGQVEEAAAESTTKPYAPFASWSAFVTRQFTDLTAKAPTAAQLASWTGPLAAGSKTKGDLIASLRATTDNTSTVDSTVRLYRALLGRAPDAGGLRFWVSRRRSGNWTLNRMADSFVASPEFKTKYGSLTNRQFVTRIYTDVLGRTADAAGVTYWTGKLDKKQRTRGSVMVGFSESGEYKTEQAQNTDVAVAYIFLLGRAPSAAETIDWVTRQKAGTTLATLAKELLGSAGYRAHITS